MIAMCGCEDGQHAPWPRPAVPGWRWAAATPGSAGPIRNIARGRVRAGPRPGWPPTRPAHRCRRRFPVQHHVDAQHHASGLHDGRCLELALMSLRAGHAVGSLRVSALQAQLHMVNAGASERAGPVGGEPHPAGDQVDVHAERAGAAAEAPGRAAAMARRPTGAPAARRARAPDRRCQATCGSAVHPPRPSAREDWSSRGSATGIGGSARPAAQAATPEMGRHRAVPSLGSRAAIRVS